MTTFNTAIDFPFSEADEAILAASELTAEARYEERFCVAERHDEDEDDDEIEAQTEAWAHFIDALLEVPNAA